MEIKKVIIGGNREEINKTTGEHHPNLIKTVKLNDLIFTPEMLIRKLFKGSNQEYNTWLIKNKLHPSQVNYYNTNQKHELLSKLKIYTMNLLNEAKIDPLFPNELGNIIVTRWINSFDILENHIYDLSAFNKIEFLKISDTFKKRFTTNSPFAFLTIDDINQQIKVIESHKVLLLLDKKLPMGNKRGIPPGQEPKKLYQNFFTSIGYKGRGELTEGLNHHRTNFKNFNFNLNIETRLLNDIIYEVLNYDKEKIQIAFIFGAYSKKLYFESDIKGIARTQKEMEALSIVEGITSQIKRTLHKERQGSIPVDKTSIEVKKRIKHPKISKEKKSFIKEGLEYEKNILHQHIDNTLEEFEKEIFKKQQGYAELAKEKITEALNNRKQYIKEFYTFLNKGMGVSDSLNKFSERYASNPYIKGIIETSIAGELQLQALKDKGIKNLKHTINLLKNKLQALEKDLGLKETEIAILNQNMESMITAHTKQLEEIEINISNLVSQQESLLKKNYKQSEIIAELEKLITQYEKTLHEKNLEIKKNNDDIFNLKDKLSLHEKLENDNKFLSQKINNYKIEIQHYLRQIQQLKSENKLILSTTDLLKTNNKQLETQLERLSKNQKILESKNKELQKLNYTLLKKIEKEN